LAERLGIVPPRAVYAVVGGETPTTKIHEAALRIMNGNSVVAVITGGEAQNAVAKAKAAGIDLLGTICNQQILPTRLNDYGHEYGYVHHYATTSNPEPTWEKALGERMQPQLDRLGHLLQRKSVK
jgi:acetyl-CoA acetyltransferase